MQNSKPRVITEYKVPNIDKYYQVFLEALESRKFQEGQVPFRKSDFNDPKIKKILGVISKHSNIPVSELINTVQDKIAELKKYQKISPLLYDTMALNFIEGEVFNMLQPGMVPTAAQFSKAECNRLIRRIKTEHSQFFPLRNFVDPKHLYDPVVMYVPDPKHPEFDNLPTACALPNGNFVFNTEFLQKLMDYAHAEGLKPKGLKYKSNGGEFDDEWAYVEFVILHEFLHYTYADFFYHKEIQGANMKIINWVGDFRSNYLLVKSGYEQLPIGLYNDKINYDRQTSYKQMYKLVKDEFDKLQPNEQEEISDQLDSQSDDHRGGEEGGEGQPGQPGQGQPGQPGKGGKPGQGQPGEGGEGGEAQPGESKDGKTGKGQSGQGAGEPGEKKDGDDAAGGAAQDVKDNEKGMEKPGSGGAGEEVPDADNEIWDKIDKAEERIKRAFKNAQDKSPKEHQETAGQGGSPALGKSRNYGSGKDTDSYKIDYSKIKPKYNWSSIVKMFVKADTDDTEETYQKPARRSASGVYTAAQVGAGAMKPGDVPLDSESKLCAIIDSSGSMDSVIPKVYANLFNLFKQNPGLQKALFTLIKFSGDYHIYKGVFAQDKAGPVSNVLEKPAQMNMSVKTLFSQHIGSMTNFSAELATNAAALLNKNYNIIIFSDSDICASENLKNVMSLIKTNPRNVFILFATRSDYIAFRQNAKMSTVNISYIEER